MSNAMSNMIRRNEERTEEARQEFIDTCRRMSQHFTDAADHAEHHRLVSDSVISSSLLRDIPRLAAEYRLLKEAVREVKACIEFEATHAPKPGDSITIPLNLDNPQDAKLVSAMKKAGAVRKEGK